MRDFSFTHACAVVQDHMEMKKVQRNEGPSHFRRAFQSKNVNKALSLGVSTVGNSIIIPGWGSSIASIALSITVVQPRPLALISIQEM